MIIKVDDSYTTLRRYIDTVIESIENGSNISDSQITLMEIGRVAAMHEGQTITVNGEVIECVNLCLKIDKACKTLNEVSA